MLGDVGSGVLAWVRQSRPNVRDFLAMTHMIISILFPQSWHDRSYSLSKTPFDYQRVVTISTHAHSGRHFGAAFVGL